MSCFKTDSSFIVYLGCGQPSPRRATRSDESQAGSASPQLGSPILVRTLARASSSALRNSVLPDNLWAIYSRSERLARVAHRVGRAFVASDARPSPWTTVHCLQGRQWHSQTHCDKGEPRMEPPRRGSHRAEPARQTSWASAAPTNSPDEAEIQTAASSRNDVTAAKRIGAVLAVAPGVFGGVSNAPNRPTTHMTTADKA